MITMKDWRGISVSYPSLALFFLIIFLDASVFATARLLLLHKPDPNEAAATARWLASQNSWGVLSTISSDLGGAPFGNVVSFSDGLPGKGRGIPYFYLTSLDPTARDALKDERASFTVSEFPIGSCGKIDPENPTCAKLTLTGKVNALAVPVLDGLLFCYGGELLSNELKLVDSNSTEAKFARRALFSKHDEMRDWPKNHNFQIFKLDIKYIFLIDWFGGPKPITLAQYLDLKKNHFAQHSSSENPLHA